MTSEVEKIQKKTAGELYDFVQAAAWKGIISESLAAHLRGAIKKIFSATAEPGELWRELPLVSDISGRIATLRKRNNGECSEKTIEAYHKRYDRSLRLFMEYPDGFPAPPVAPARDEPLNEPAQAPPVPNAQTVAIQKVLAASLKFQQEVLSALALLTNQEGGAPPMSAG